MIGLVSGLFVWSLRVGAAIYLPPSRVGTVPTLRHRQHIHLGHRQRRLIHLP